MFPVWGKVVLWLGVVFVFFLSIWYTPYAVLLAWGIPRLWDRWHRHLEVMEELVYLMGKEKEHGDGDEEVAGVSSGPGLG